MRTTDSTINEYEDLDAYWDSLIKDGMNLKAIEACTSIAEKIVDNLSTSEDYQSEDARRDLDQIRKRNIFVRNRLKELGYVQNTEVIISDSQ